jgi:AraC-like DNA-binding protein
VFGTTDFHFLSCQSNNFYSRNLSIETDVEEILYRIWIYIQFFLYSRIVDVRETWFGDWRFNFLDHYLLLNQCTEAGERRSGSAPPGNVRRCKDFILEHYAQPLTLDELARVSALSRFHLVRAFGTFFGLAPHAFQIHVRVEKAQRLLDAGLSPASVAAETGFADQSHFTHHFVRITGLTPGRYARG